MKTLICYKTRMGTTKKYVEWLAADVGAEIKTFAEVQSADFGDYDLIVVSSGTYAGLMPLTRFLKKHWKHLKDKKVVVVAVGAAPADDKWSTFSYNRIPKRIREGIQYFKIEGEIPEGDKRPKEYKSPVKKANLAPVVEYINSP